MFIEIPDAAVRRQGSLAPVYEHYGATYCSETKHNFAVATAIRLAALVSGSAILATATWSAIEAQGLHGPGAALAAALAGGVAVGAALVPRVTKGVAAAILAALVFGEAYGVLMTAERIVAQRDAAASVTLASNGQYDQAAARFSKAEAALSAHRQRAVSVVAKPNCARECRAILDGQTTALVVEMQDARRAVADAPAIKSATPLADRLGLQPWMLDLVAAALLSIAANGLAGVLIATGARPVARLERAQERASPPVSSDAVVTVPSAEKAPDAGRSGGIAVAPERPAVAVAKAQIVDLAKAGAIKHPVRGLAAVIGSSPTATHAALAALLAAGVLERVADGIALAQRAA